MIVLEKLSNWLIKNNLDGRSGCYAFFDRQSCLYVGMTNKGFEDRLKKHFDDDDKTFTNEFDRVEFWLINQSGEFEAENNEKENVNLGAEIGKLLIKKFQPSENENKGNLSDPCEQLVKIIDSEISGLCKDGELLDKENSISELKEALKSAEAKQYIVDVEGGKGENFCV